MEGQEARAPGGQDRYGPESVAQETRVFMLPGLLQAHGSAQTHPAPLLLSAAASSPHCSHCEMTELIPGADGPDAAEASSHLFCRFYQVRHWMNPVPSQVTRHTPFSVLWTRRLHLLCWLFSCPRGAWAP